MAGGEGVQEISSLSPSPRRQKPCRFGHDIIPTTRVLWDLHTCPVPDDVDPRRVRASIESALKNHFGRPRPLTVYAVGNLEYVSPRLLEEISSSGIFLSHAPFRAIGVIPILKEWRVAYRTMTHVMLISGDATWFNEAFYFKGYTILRAFPHPRPPLRTFPDTKEWGWESLLKENSVAVQTSSQMIVKGEPPCFCRLCNIPIQSCDDFIKHLEGVKHQEKAVIQRRYEPVKANYEPVLFCQVCKYTGNNRSHMAKHYKSLEHSQKKWAAIKTVAEDTETMEGVQENLRRGSPEQVVEEGVQENLRRGSPGVQEENSRRGSPEQGGEQEVN